jgi:hypothetical protein
MSEVQYANAHQRGACTWIVVLQEEFNITEHPLRVQLFEQSPPYCTADHLTHPISGCCPIRGVDEYLTKQRHHDRTKRLHTIDDACRAKYVSSPLFGVI